MYKLNCLLYPNVKEFNISSKNSVQILENNIEFEAMKKEFTKKYNFNELKTYSFSKEGMLGLLLELKGKIAVSVGESEAIVEAAKFYEKLGFDVIWIGLNEDGTVKIEDIKNKELDYIFISSYVMDTFVKTDLSIVKKLTKAKIISNSSANFSQFSDIAIFDSYKISGYSNSAIILYNNEELEEQNMASTDALAVFLCFESLKTLSFETSFKDKFITYLKNEFGDDMYFFVEPELCLPYSLHFGLKKIKAREIIRTLALSDVYITNGEGCSLGFSKPSRIIQEMGHPELTSRNAISLSTAQVIDDESLEKIAKLFHKKYRQIRVLNEQ